MASLINARTTGRKTTGRMAKVKEHVKVRTNAKVRAYTKVRTYQR